jgi:plastocyanin
MSVLPFDYSTEENNDELELIVKGDVVMPSKVSRPGCEEIDRCYIPSIIVIESGKQVIWVNEDSAFHSVTSGFYDAPSDLFDSGYLDPSESFTFTFDESGTYDYFCTLHPWMNGQVIVE